MQKWFTFDTKTVVTIGIGAALYGVLGIFGFMIGPNTYIKPAIALLTVFGAMFGPVVAFLVGFIGHTLTDMLAGFGVWWGWVLASAIMGLSMGLVYTRKGFSVKNGELKRNHIMYLAISGIIGIIVAITFAGYFDILVMGEPADKIFVQITSASISNIIVLLVLGIPAVLGLAKLNQKNSNLKVEQ